MEALSDSEPACPLLTYLLSEAALKRVHIDVGLFLVTRELG